MSRRIQGPLPFDTVPNCLRTLLRTVFGGELIMASSLYFILPALGGYTLTSLYLLKNPQILHKKKRAAFHCTHISHRGGKEGTAEGCSSHLASSPFLSNRWLWMGWTSESWMFGACGVAASRRAEWLYWYDPVTLYLDEYVFLIWAIHISSLWGS